MVLDDNFEGFWIPRVIWEQERLTPTEKMFLVEIYRLQNGDEGCSEGNEYFNNFFGVCTRTTRFTIGSLKSKGYIRRVMKHAQFRTLFLTKRTKRMLGLIPEDE